jgi:CxxC-x17-CxxC domain-containing protein
MAFEDKTLTCAVCGQPFTFTVKEQEFNAQKGMGNAPKRCRGCREARRAADDNGGVAPERYEVICSCCGEKTTVPFKPTGTRPILCRKCFQSRRAARNS